MSKMYSEFGCKFRIEENYKFRLHKMLANDIEKWVCTEKRCSGAYMKIQHGVIVDESHDHNHEPVPSGILMRQKVMNGCKRRAVRDIFERPSKLMRRETTKGSIRSSDRVRPRSNQEGDPRSMNENTSSATSHLYPNCMIS